MPLGGQNRRGRDGAGQGSCCHSSRLDISGTPTVGHWRDVFPMIQTPTGSSSHMSWSGCSAQLELEENINSWLRLRCD